MQPFFLQNNSIFIVGILKIFFIFVLTKKQKQKVMNTQNNHSTEDQKYLDARLLMMQYERIGKMITLEKALELTDY